MRDPYTRCRDRSNENTEDERKIIKEIANVLFFSISVSLSISLTLCLFLVRKSMVCWKIGLYEARSLIRFYRDEHKVMGAIRD